MGVHIGDQLYQMMFVAGTETSSVSLEWAMALLLNHPKAMKKLKAELDEHVGHERLLKESDIAKLPYLRHNADGECLGHAQRSQTLGGRR
ncbi:hypothetical protein OIU84_012981 [Salix udensis]|uniref:Cytochrome P450 n=1 Tax=Salix udensis TaxID=889485 RepID=A0AAD6JIS7_9ROSI|nr:hypothetical protein OIU84_012981 [Salix udensis]